MSRGSVWHLCRDRNDRPLKRERDEETGRLPPHADGCRRGRWGLAVRVPTSTDPRAPKVQVKRTGFDRKEDAERALADVQGLLRRARTDWAIQRVGRLIINAVVRDGALVLPDDDDVGRSLGARVDPAEPSMTTADWLDRWLDPRNKMHKMRPTTRQGVRGEIEQYFRPHIGDIPLDELQPEHIAQLFAWIEDRNEVVREARAAGVPVRHDDLDPRTLHRPVGLGARRHLYAHLRAALNWAVRRRLIQVNPCDMVVLEDVPRKERLVWNPTQVGHFLKFTEGDRLHVAWRIVLLRGLRRGEVAGLKWDDVTLDDRPPRLSIRRQLVYLDGEVVESGVKSDDSARTVVLDPGTVQALREHKLAQDVERWNAGAAYADHGYVFPDELGRPIPPKSLTNRFQRATREAGLGTPRLHDGRHTAATLARVAGTDMKTVQELLGHSNIKLTADLYTHLVMEVHEDAAANVAALLPDQAAQS